MNDVERMLADAKHIGCLKPTMPFAQGPNPSDELAPCGECELCQANARIDQLENGIRWALEDLRPDTVRGAIAAQRLVNLQDLIDYPDRRNG